MYTYFRFPTQALKVWSPIALIKCKMKKKKKNTKSRIRTDDVGDFKPVQSVKDAEIEVYHEEYTLWGAERRQLCGWAFLFGNTHLKHFKLW